MACFRLELLTAASDTQCPHARSGHRVVVDDGNLYALGGYNPDVVDSDVENEEELCKRIFLQMWTFNFFSRKWTEIQMLGDCPLYLASHSASLHGKTLLTFGGSGIPFGTRSSQSVHMCRVEPGIRQVHWHKIPVSGKVPESKYGHCQLHEWPYLYIVGGTTGYVYNSDVHRLDLRNGEWTCIWDSQNNPDNFRDSPVGRYRHEMVLYKQQLLMLGGGQAILSLPLDKIPYFDLTCNRWKEHLTTHDLSMEHSLPQAGENNGDIGIPSRRRCHSCVLHNDAVYLFGGRDLEPLGDMWQLNLSTFCWTCVLPSSLSPYACFFHSAAVTAAGCMYVFGGVTWTDDEMEEVRTHDVYRVWLCVPLLQELAWEVISRQLHSCRSPTLYTELLHAGVPQHFTQRLLS